MHGFKPQSKTLLFYLTHENHVSAPSLYSCCNDEGTHFRFGQSPLTIWPLLKCIYILSPAMNNTIWECRTIPGRCIWECWAIWQCVKKRDHQFFLFYILECYPLCCYLINPLLSPKQDCCSRMLVCESATQMLSIVPKQVSTLLPLESKQICEAHPWHPSLQAIGPYCLAFFNFCIFSHEVIKKLPHCNVNCTIHFAIHFGTTWWSHCVYWLVGGGSVISISWWL